MRIKMNVYDFDKTIYNGDSTIDFYLFCLKKHPSILLYIPAQIKGVILFKMGKIEKKKFKELFFSFLVKINDIERDIVLFWDEHEIKIKEWYKNKHREDDVIISASPHFLLKEICKRQKIKNLIATKVDKKTGKFESENCYGQEKVLRFSAQFGEKSIDEFYSDSFSDEPMSKMAKNSFIVKGDDIKPWQCKY